VVIHLPRVYIYIVPFIYNGIEYDMIFIIVFSHFNETYHDCWSKKEDCGIVPHYRNRE